MPGGVGALALEGSEGLRRDGGLRTDGAEGVFRVGGGSDQEGCCACVRACVGLGGYGWWAPADAPSVIVPIVPLPMGAGLSA